MNENIFEKESEIALSLLAAVAGESIILLGPPGVAKSMVARRLKLAFADARSFEYLMSRFSTPDEIFGPVSISKLKTSDTYERAVDGYLPTSDVVFLDEIWKAGPAIQNTLLTVINEKLFRNGNREIHLPLKLLVAASNELPAKGEGLEALWDRFVIRLESRPVRTEAAFDAMILGGVSDSHSEKPISENAITNEEYANWQTEIDKVEVSKDVLSAIHGIHRNLHSVVVDDTDEPRDVYVSDRRWKNIVRLLRTSAFLQDRKQVTLEDLLPAYHCLWQEPEERDAVRKIVVRNIFAQFSERFNAMKKDLADDIQYRRKGRDYSSEIEQLSDELGKLDSSIRQSLFIFVDDRKELDLYLKEFYRQLAFARQDTVKLA